MAKPRRLVGAFCTFEMSEEMYDDICNDAPPKDVARMKFIMEQIAASGPYDLTNQQFKLEGRFPSGHSSTGDVAVYALKSYQLRIYGGFRNKNKVNTFVCVEYAIKQKDKADPKQLKRVAKKIGTEDA